MISDSDLKSMSLFVANSSLSLSDKFKWVSVHNSTANIFFIRNGVIKPVPVAGWWY